jgi:hypothetical protein
MVVVYEEFALGGGKSEILPDNNNKDARDFKDRLGILSYVSFQ